MVDVHGPIAVGEHSVVVDGKTWRHKDVVNAGFGFQIRVKVDKGAVLGKPEPCVCVRVIEDATFAESAVNLIVLVNIEVAREHHRGPFGNGTLRSTTSLAPSRLATTPM